MTRVKCKGCELVQFGGENCRRCHRRLTVTVDEPPITLAEAELLALRRAVAQARSREETAQLLGCGKSTLYRMLRRHGLRLGKEPAQLKCGRVT